jgi:hypothetical protein
MYFPFLSFKPNCVGQAYSCVRGISGASSFAASFSAVLN